MNRETMIAAKKEARELIKRIDSCMEEANQSGRSGLRGNINYHASPKSTGAVRRQSMELTRALAELRRHS